MKEIKLSQALAKACRAPIFSDALLTFIKENNLWNIWVPKSHGGLELSFGEGLKALQNIAKADGTLGWTVTLCSGANYFIGNLQPETASIIFDGNAILGGSGGLFGTAEKQGDTYLLNGFWRYATGANYLTHFTLNAKIIEDGVELTNEDGSPQFLSFIIPAEAVEIVEDWNTMGLQASVTHSFKVENYKLHERFSFVYNRFYFPQDVFKVHWSLFADMTLWVNYIGMAEHFLEEAEKVVEQKLINTLQLALEDINKQVEVYTESIENIIRNNKQFDELFVKEVHQKAAEAVRKISAEMIQLFPMLGVKASREDHPLNHIFKDYFTATQHHIFSRK